MTQFQVTFVSCTQTNVLFCLFVGTRVPEAQANNLSAGTLERYTRQPSAFSTGDSGAGAGIRLPSSGRKDEHPR